MIRKETSSHSGLTSTRRTLRNDIIKLFEDYNVHIVTESGKEVTIYCPFHHNSHSPAFYINTTTGLWQCFNPSCGKKGNFRQLYRHIAGKSYGKDVDVDHVALKKELDLAMNPITVEDILELDSVSVDYESDDVELLKPFLDRGFSLETMRYFDIGFSRVKNRIVIPVRDQHYKVVGLIGRTVVNEDPKYLYNKGFKRADVLFNINNAKRFDSVIVAEGSLDCMKTHQAGFPNIVATLGARVSANQIAMMKKYFDEIIVFSDNDEAGESMARDIISSCLGKRIFKANMQYGFKDPADMTEKQIQQSITEKQEIYF
jgi:DNA primase